MLLEMLAEAARNPAVAEILHKHSKGMRDLLADLVRKGQDAGEVDSSLDADLVAAILMSVVDGSRNLAVRDPKTGQGQDDGAAQDHDRAVSGTARTDIRKIAAGTTVNRDPSIPDNGKSMQSKISDS